jgi:hypothetical protein
MNARELAEEIVDEILFHLAVNNWVRGQLEAMPNEAYDNLEERLVYIVEEKLNEKNSMDG